VGNGVGARGGYVGITEGTVVGRNVGGIDGSAVGTNGIMLLNTRDTVPVHVTLPAHPS